MLLFVSWIGAALALVFSLLPFAMTRRLRRHVAGESIRRPGQPCPPKAALIVPCKGTDLNFAENIGGFLSFSYPNYEVVFVTATADDPARAELEQIIAAHPNGARARLLVAGIEEGRGQKMTNMLRAVESVGKDVEVLVFMDADIGTHAGLLESLIEPLTRPGVGATTGFPVFVPTGGFGSLLKSVWGFGGMLLMADRKRNFTHAAVTCLRMDVYRRAGIHERLKSTLSDSMAVTRALRELGLEIHFVPKAVVVAEDRSSVAEAVRWTNRMTVYTRVYNRPFWWMVMLSYCLSNGMLACGMALLVGVAIGGDGDLLPPAVIMTATLIAQIAHAFATFPLLLRLLVPYPAAMRRLRGLRVWLCLLSPAGSLLILLNSLMSLTTNVVTWRGIRYRLVSPTRTEVLGTA